jgi:hypothetical protein
MPVFGIIQGEVVVGIIVRELALCFWRLILSFFIGRVIENPRPDPGIHEATVRIIPCNACIEEDTADPFVFSAGHNVLLSHFS